VGRPRGVQAMLWCKSRSRVVLVIAGCAEIVWKFGGGVVNAQVTAWAASFCKSVGVCLRRFESCTCHRSASLSARPCRGRAEDES
jgi:hypothetical protein